jgi:hypothetical protein
MSITPVFLPLCAFSHNPTGLNLPARIALQLTDLLCLFKNRLVSLCHAQTVGLLFASNIANAAITVR